MYLIFSHSLEESQLEKAGRHLSPTSKSAAQRFVDIKENLPLFFNILKSAGFAALWLARCLCLHVEIFVLALCCFSGML